MKRNQMWGGEQLQERLVNVDELLKAHRKRAHPAVLAQNGDDQLACCAALGSFVCATVASIIWQYLEQFTVTARGEMRYVDRRTYWRLLAVQTADRLEKSLLRQTTKRWFLTPRTVEFVQHPESHGSFMLVQQPDNHLDRSTLNCWVESERQELPHDASAVDAPDHTRAYMQVVESNGGMHWDVWTFPEGDHAFLCHLQGRTPLISSASPRRAAKRPRY
jgi:hypothetical protein